MIFLHLLNFSNWSGVRNSKNEWMNAVLLFYHNSKISKVGISQLTFWFRSFLDLARSLEIIWVDYTSDV